MSKTRFTSHLDTENYGCRLLVSGDLHSNTATTGFLWNNSMCPPPYGFSDQQVDAIVEPEVARHKQYLEEERMRS